MESSPVPPLDMLLRVQSVNVWHNLDLGVSVPMYLCQCMYLCVCVF